MNIIYHIIRIILSVGTILILIHNEKIYQAYKYTHPTNKIRITITNPNPIHIGLYQGTYNNTKNYEITNSTYRNDRASNPK